MRKFVPALVICFLLSELCLAQGWSTMPVQIDSPLSNNVSVIYEYDDTLYVFGAFTTIDSITVNSIARWNGSDWYKMGEGVNYVSSYGSDIAYYKDYLYIGGSFTLYFDSSQTKHIARWDGAIWDSVGTGVLGLTQRVNALAVYKEELYAGGNFVEIGGLSANRIARWNDTTWSTVDGGMSGGGVSVRCMAVYNDELYVAGGFFNAGPVTTSSIARWDGTQWNDVGGPIGAGGYINTMTVDTFRNLLYVSVGGVGVKEWDGNSWTQISGGSTGDTVPGGGALGMYMGELYSGGQTIGANAAGDTLAILARWNGTEWNAVGQGTNSTVMAFGVYRDTLYVGGLFNIAGGERAIHLARWVVDTTLGIEGWVNEKYSLSLYPNPSKDCFTVETNIQQENAEVKIYDIKGGLLHSYPISTGKRTLQIATTSWSTGIYICKLEAKGKTLRSKKMVVE